MRPPRLSIWFLLLGCLASSLAAAPKQLPPFRSWFLLEGSSPQVTKPSCKNCRPRAPRKWRRETTPSESRGLSSPSVPQDSVRLSPENRARLFRRLTPEIKADLLRIPTQGSSFEDRRQLLRIWISQLEYKKIPVPAGIRKSTLREEAEYLRDLKLVNLHRALERLDACFQLLAQADPTL